MHLDDQHTKTAEYAAFLGKRQRRPWKRVIDVQAPYRWNIRRLFLGRVLDIGCGNGRNLEHLRGHGVGVDHNESFVRICRAKGLEAYTPQEFADAGIGPRFDAILLSHVAEHVDFDSCVSLVKSYRTYLEPTAKLVVITPQQLGFRSDPTHVLYYDRQRHADLIAACGAAITQQFSFPFPSWAGTIFTYNETISVARFTA